MNTRTCAKNWTFPEVAIGADQKERGPSGDKNVAPR